MNFNMSENATTLASEFWIEEDCNIGEIVSTSESGFNVKLLSTCKSEWWNGRPVLQFDDADDDVTLFMIWSEKEKAAWDFSPTHRKSFSKFEPKLNQIIAFNIKQVDNKNTDSIRSAVPLLKYNSRCVHQFNYVTCKRPIQISADNFGRTRNLSKIISRNQCICGAGLCSQHDLCLTCEGSIEAWNRARDDYQPYMWE